MRKNTKLPQLFMSAERLNYQDVRRTAARSTNGPHWPAASKPDTARSPAGASIRYKQCAVDASKLDPETKGAGSCNAYDGVITQEAAIVRPSAGQVPLTSQSVSGGKGNTPLKVFRSLLKQVTARSCSSEVALTTPTHPAGAAPQDADNHAFAVRPVPQPASHPNQHGRMQFAKVREIPTAIARNERSGGAAAPSHPGLPQREAMTAGDPDAHTRPSISALQQQLCIALMAELIHGSTCERHEQLQSLLVLAAAECVLGGDLCRWYVAALNRMSTGCSLDDASESLANGQCPSTTPMISVPPADIGHTKAGTAAAVCTQAARQARSPELQHLLNCTDSDASAVGANGLPSEQRSPGTSPYLAPPVLPSHLAQAIASLWHPYSPPSDKDVGQSSDGSSPGSPQTALLRPPNAPVTTSAQAILQAAAATMPLEAPKPMEVCQSYQYDQRQGIDPAAKGLKKVQAVDGAATAGDAAAGTRPGLKRKASKPLGYVPSDAWFPILQLQPDVTAAAGQGCAGAGARAGGAAPLAHGPQSCLDVGKKKFREDISRQHAGFDDSQRLPANDVRPASNHRPAAMELAPPHSSSCSIQHISPMDLYMLYRHQPDLKIYPRLDNARPHSMPAAFDNTAAIGAAACNNPLDCQPQAKQFKTETIGGCFPHSIGAAVIPGLASPKAFPGHSCQGQPDASAVVHCSRPMHTNQVKIPEQASASNAAMQMPVRLK